MSGQKERREGAGEPLGNGAERPSVLMVTGIEGIETIAGALAEKLKLRMEIVSTRAAALRVLERRVYTLVVVVDQLLVDVDPEGADLLWKNAGLAIPLQFSFALAGSERLEREIRAAVARRRREQELAAAAALADLDAQLKNAVTGLLLESELALAVANLPPEVSSRLQRLSSIVERMRKMLADPAAEAVAASASGTLPRQVGHSAAAPERGRRAAATPVGLQATGS